MTHYLDRIKKVQHHLQSLGIDALYVDDLTNLYYLTGIELSAGKMLIGKTQAHLIVDGRYIEKCQKASPIPVILSTETIIKDQLTLSHYRDVQVLGFDEETTSYKSGVELSKMLEEHNKKLKPVKNIVKEIRSIKDPAELAYLRKAASLGSEGYDYVCTLLKEGITEQEIALELEIFWRRKGGDKLAFDPIIAFGANTSMPHYRAGTAKLTKGMPVLIDIGVNLNHYHSDMTRVVFFGQANPKLQEIYQVVKDAQQKGLDACRPGITAGELDAVVRQYIADKGYESFFTHNLGHGVGLEIHELPSLRNKSPDKDVKLLAGMVITIEPGIYLPGVGGVRIEDTVVVTPEGHENLTNRNK